MQAAGAAVHDCSCSHHRLLPAGTRSTALLSTRARSPARHCCASHGTSRTRATLQVVVACCQALCRLPCSCRTPLAQQRTRAYAALGVLDLPRMCPALNRCVLSTMPVVQTLPWARLKCPAACSDARSLSSSTMPVVQPLPWTRLKCWYWTSGTPRCRWRSCSGTRCGSLATAQLLV